MESSRPTTPRSRVLSPPVPAYGRRRNAPAAAGILSATRSLPPCLDGVCGVGLRPTGRAST
jgi:hypothetical protein